MEKSIEDIERDVAAIQREITRLEILRDRIKYERAMLEINHQKILLNIMRDLGPRYRPPLPFYFW